MHLPGGKVGIAWARTGSLETNEQWTIGGLTPKGTCGNKPTIQIPYRDVVRLVHRNSNP